MTVAVISFGGNFDGKVKWGIWMEKTMVRERV
jgi:hypothetical protein